MRTSDIHTAIPQVTTTDDPNAKPTGTIEIPKPKLRLHVNDLRHSGCNTFLSLVPSLASTIDNALVAIIENLYTIPRSSPPRDPSKAPPIFTPSVSPTRSVTIFLRDIDGVAYTNGAELDDDHKEIHISLQYIHKALKLPNPRAEIVGVLTHELVHCYQHTAPRQAGDSAPRPPGGLIEGIADFVRLKAGFAPPHWKRPTSARERPEKWDQGYQHTAYFLEWLEDVHIGKGAIGMLNDRLLRVGYVGEGLQMEGEAPGTGSSAPLPSFWRDLFGSGIKQLWEDYGTYLDKPNKTNDAQRNDGNWEDEIINPFE
ncbi:hypothetical protein BDV29DRAFT_21063 [Aspergillus leporis]|jgi:hypothetical protein|uniref:Peptidase of plants and bacteria-domain-containing protein n=1 Tax=Aspergillus leporis TaxID=41062 RepID=A0A5N5XDB6_9EURO|nr:hypothetical protein BDV29DRAFT_21063 [Aspergillus leporis]